MLAVQEYLRSGKTLDDLKAEYGINSVIHSSDPLVVINYDQIDSHQNRYHQIVCEARALCLELNTWNTVGKAYNRFFNLGETCLNHTKFDWSNFTCQEKIDGSCLPVVHYNGTWRLHSRGGFGQSEINGSGYTWQSLFFPLLKNLEAIPPNYTLIFEGTSVYNKIVVTYGQGKPLLFLLTAFNRDTYEELPLDEVDQIAATIGVLRPKVYKFINQENMLSWLEAQPGKDFEGVVCKDRQGIRLKVKVADYVRLHHLLGGGNLFLPKYLVPICINNSSELDEIKATFPELIPNIEQTQKILGAAYLEAKTAFETASPLTTQREKAIVLQGLTRLTSPSFTAWKTGRPFDEIWRESASMLVKHLF